MLSKIHSNVLSVLLCISNQHELLLSNQKLSTKTIRCENLDFTTSEADLPPVMFLDCGLLFLSMVHISSPELISLKIFKTHETTPRLFTYKFTL